MSPGVHSKRTDEPPDSESFSCVAGGLGSSLSTDFCRLSALLSMDCGSRSDEHAPSTTSTPTAMSAASFFTSVAFHQLRALEGRLAIATDEVPHHPAPHA